MVVSISFLPRVDIFVTSCNPLNEWRKKKRKKNIHKKLCDKINQVILNPSVSNDSIRRILKYKPERSFENGTAHLRGHLIF